MTSGCEAEFSTSSAVSSNKPQSVFISTHANLVQLYCFQSFVGYRVRRVVLVPIASFFGFRHVPAAFIFLPQPSVAFF
ncbi:hypothetical protein RMSM_04671 [Rhodopirellula maiorica SM1]|uniref:Uncharacterized protein n=1 Tax=Rhodopirellula maiorica SM1 TaxID=1265738 RepID=M5RSP4_9BACT|nr:hypothetical protein RMSM_04671 [Rhodopirellula maiorica SM1]